MAQPTNGLDGEILNLDGGIFALPAPEAQRFASAPVILPEVDDQAATQVMPRVKLDTMAPIAMPEPVAERAPAPPASRRSSPWTFLGGMAAGVALILGAHALGKLRPAAGPDSRSTTAALAAAPVEAPRAVAVPTPPAPVEALPQATQPKEPVKAQAPEAPKPVAAPKPASAAPRAPAPVAPAPEAEPASTADLPSVLAALPPPPKPAEVQINRSAVAVAIAAAGARANACKEADQGATSVRVSVTFMPSGQAARATVNGGPLAGTPAASCVAQALRAASVPAFDGEPVTVSTTLHLQ